MTGIPVLLLALIVVSQQTGDQALSFIVANRPAKGQELHINQYNTPTAYDDLKVEVKVEGEDQMLLAVTRRLEGQQTATTGATIAKIATSLNPITAQNEKKAAEIIEAAKAASKGNLQTDGNPLSTNFFPLDSNYRMIKKALITTVCLYIILQVLACMCVKKRVRYTEKFEQFSQRAEVEELEDTA